MTPLFTIATPTYNRADTLRRTYESLIAQRFRDFEWLVVDDGSTDGTAELVRGWQGDSPFTVRYLWQENQHKKTAMNHAVREAKGSYIAFLDSDDGLLPGALEDMWTAWQAIPEDHRGMFVGVVGHCVDPQGQIIGDLYPQDPLDVDSITTRYIMRIKGEKWGFQRTDVMKEYPFPEFLTGLVPEDHIWDKIALRYRTRFVNKALRIYYPTEGSIIHAQAISSSRQDFDGSLYHSAQFLDEMAPRLWRRAPRAVFDNARQYCRFTLHMHRQGRANRWRPRKITSRMILMMFNPLGRVLYWKDLLAGRRVK